MSAFMCSDEHVNRILDAVKAHASVSALARMLGGSDYQSINEGLTIAGRAMHAENVRSMTARYDLPADEEFGYRQQAQTFVYVQGGERQVTPTAVEALKLIDSWRYQSCEHPESARDADTWTLVRNFQAVLIGSLPGYDAAEWSV